MKNIYIFLVSAMAAFTLFACSQDKTDTQDKNEIVMNEGMSIKVSNSYGEMEITAGKGYVRNYTWNGATRSAELIPRKSRWNGSLGIYFPGEGNHWKEHDGITRAVLEEGQQHFRTVEEATEWIKKENHWGYVYRDDGLVVGWDKMTGAGGTLGVSVWQIFINGQKPTFLTGSQNTKITVEPGSQG